MKKQTGSGLIFAVILLFVILGMVVTLSSVTVLETKMNQKTKSSVGAFYNADSGVEWALNRIATGTEDKIDEVFSGAVWDATGKITCPLPNCEVYLLGADGKVISQSQFSDPDSAQLVKAVRAVGTQGGETQRAIEAAVAETSQACFTFHCFNSDHSSYGTPVCTDEGTPQGFCPDTFNQALDLGPWNLGYLASGNYSFCPEMSNCTYGGYVPEVLGRAFVCCKDY
jgi:hypothetical protein